MGNLIASNKYTLADIDNLKNTLGTINEPTYNTDNTSNELIGIFGENNLLNVYLDKIHVPTEDKELLNRFLTELHNKIKVNSEFPEKCESGELVSSSINEIDDFNESHLSILHDILNENTELSKVKDIKSANCIYKFPEGTIKMHNRFQSVPIDKAYVGVHNGGLSILSTVENFEETCKISISWWIYELEEGEKYVIPTSIEPFLVNENKMEELKLLEDASELLKQNNDRLMKSKLDNFKKWKEQIIKAGEVGAVVGGNQIGDLDSLTEFFDKLEIL